MRYAGFLSLQSISKGTIDMNKDNLEKCKIQVLLLVFLLEIWVEHATSLYFQTPSEMSIKGIRMTLAALMISLW